MRFSSIISALVLFGLSVSSQAADFIEVSKSTTINASIDAVWKKVGDFCAIQDWHPTIEKCQAYDDHGTLYRTLTLGDGNTISEKHAGEEGTSYTYYIKKSPLPVKAYKATFKAEANGDQTTITWNARFRAKGKPDEEAKAVISPVTCKPTF